MFVGVVVREQVVVPPERITMIYGALYEDMWLWRYTERNMAPQHEKFSHAYRFFFHVPLRIHSSVRKCNKKILPFGLWTAAEGGARPP